VGRVAARKSSKETLHGVGGRESVIVAELRRQSRQIIIQGTIVCGRQRIAGNNEDFESRVVAEDGTDRSASPRTMSCDGMRNEIRPYGYAGRGSA